MKKKILVSVDAGETRVAVFERKGNAKPRVGELYVERRGSRSIVGNIYKGVVDNVLPGMEAAFVDIGLERNGFLHVDEIVLPGGEKVPRRGHGKGRSIAELIKPKQEVLVQVVKDPLKTKGARLSMQLSIAGRYLVYMPQGAGVGASRRLPDAERDRLRKLLQKLHKDDGGVIVRTAAQGAKKEDFERDLDYLHKLAEVVERRAKDIKAPDLVFQEADLSIRVLRDVLSKEFEGAIIDDEKQHQRVSSFFQRTAPELVEKVELYEGNESLFEREGAEEALRSTLSRRVDLPSGGYLMIDYAEALTVIDINTGSFTGRGKGRLEDTITKVNIEAAEEVVRQLRLRDIGGIIVIDFIDMARSRNRDQVLKTMRKALDEDKTKTYVVEISPLGLVEMTSQNVTDGVREILTKKCPTCEGEGVILSEETVAIDVLRKLRELVASKPEPEAFLIRVNPQGGGEAARGGQRPARARGGVRQALPLRGRRGARGLDTSRSPTRAPARRSRRAALPFAVGEEVLVAIEEPHMYNVDDAIARVDSYIVSVAGGGRYVGQRRLVRIDEVARSLASASLVDNGDGGEAAEEGDEQQLESSGSGRRRRGRRGGRGRSRTSNEERAPSNATSNTQRAKTDG